MWRIVFDFIKRKWWDSFWMWAIIVMTLPRLVPRSDTSVGLAIAMSGLLGVFIGPLFSLGLRLPELRFLPVTRRDIWRAGWIVAVLSPTLLLALGLTIARLLHKLPLNPESIALVVLIVLLYLGAVMGVASVYPLSRRNGESGRGIGVLNLAIGVMFLGSPFWGFALRNSLPHSWADVRGLTAVALAIGAGLTVVGATYSPAEDASFSRRLLRAKPTTQQAVKPERLTGKDDGLTGLRLLARSTATMSAICLALFVVLDALFFHSLIALTPTRWPPIAQGHGQNFPIFVAFGFTALLQSSKTGTQSIRHLRTLPLGDWQLTCVLLGVPILQGVIWWAGVAVVHFVLGGWLPVLLRPELFLTLIAAGTINTAGGLLPKGGWLMIVVGMFTLFALVPVDYDSMPSATTAAILNAIAIGVIAGSAWMIHRGLNRSRALYQAPPTMQRFRGFAQRG